MNSTTELKLYRKLQLARQIEEAIRKDYFQDEMKTPVHLGIGGEAIAIGVLSALPQTTRVFGTYRNHNLYAALSENTDMFFGEIFGRANGCAEGKAGSMHMTNPEEGLILTSAVVGTTIPVAVGYAFAQKYRGKNNTVAVFFGDGAMEEGAFYESLNYASLQKLNVVFVCEDNGYAIHTHKTARQSHTDLKHLADAFGCPYFEADGKDLDAVMAATQKAVDAQKREAGPVLMKFDYFRFLQHVGPLEDFDAGYRKKPENLEQLDPLKVYEKALLAKGVKAEEFKKIEAEVKAKVQKSVDLARVSPFASSETLCSDVYANQTSKDLNLYSGG